MDNMGTIRDGKVILDEDARLPDGMRVKLIPVNEAGEELTLAFLLKYGG